VKSGKQNRIMHINLQKSPTKCDLNQTRNSTTRGTTVASKATANTSGVIALSSATTLITVEISMLNLRDIHEVWGQIQTSNLWSATITTFIRSDCDKILRTLYVLSDKTDIQECSIAIVIIGTGNINVIDNAVRQLFQCTLNIEQETGEVFRGTEKENRSCGVALIKLALECEGEGLAVEAVLGIVQSVSMSMELQVLNLIFKRGSKITSLIHDIGAVITESLRAINITITSIAVATSGLRVIPLAVGKGVGSLLKEISVLIILGDSTIRQVLDSETTTMARAIIRARTTLTGFAFIPRETFTFTRVTVANTTIGAFRILVKATNFIRGVHPGKFERTNTLRAITRQVGESDTPVVKAFANAVLHALTVTGTSVVTSRLYNDQNREKSNNRSQHVVFEIRIKFEEWRSLRGCRLGGQGP
jgi:hypothetical protein